MRSRIRIGPLVAASVATALVGALVGSFPASAGAADVTPCTPSWRPLELLPGQGHLAEVINRDGMVAGREAGGGPMSIWQPDGSGQVIELDWAEPQVLDLNNEGHVLGIAFAPSGHRRGFVWDVGTFTPVAGSGAKLLGRANAMNDSGALTGYVRIASEPKAAFWATPSSKPVALPTPHGYALSEGLVIGPHGTITGRAWNPDGGNIGDHDPAVVRWRSGVARIVDTPDIDYSRHFISFIAGHYFAGVSLDPTANDPFSTWVPESGTADTYEPIVVNGADYGQPTGLTRRGMVSGQVTFPDDNQSPTAFLMAPDGEPTVLDDFEGVVELHGFGNLTALFANRADELSVGTCLAPLLEE